MQAGLLDERWAATHRIEGTMSKQAQDRPHNHDFRFNVNVRGGCFPCVCPGSVGLVGRCAAFARLDARSPLRAFGFSGESTPLVREGGRAGSPPVTLRRIGGRSDDGGAGVDIAGGGFAGGRSLIENPAKGVVSVPSACRRAFSCRPWTSLKWARSSCHLMSSRPSLDRVDEIFAIVLDAGMLLVEKAQRWNNECTHDLGAMWRNPAEFTALSRFRSDTKAEL